MNNRPLKILLVEDNPADAVLVKEMLAGARSFDCELINTDRLEKLHALPDRERIDVILLDLSLPDVQGLETIVKTCEILPGKPIVIMSGLEDEDLAVKALQEGAQDYLVKGQVDSNLLVRSIRYAIERKVSEEALRKAYLELENRVQARTEELVEANLSLRESERKYRMLVEQASDGIFILDPEANIRDVNSTACTMLGFLREELLQMNVQELIPAKDLITIPLKHREVLSGEKVVIERRFRHKNGMIINVEVSAALLEDGRIQTIVRDLTERKKAEEALRRSKESLAEAQRIAHIGNWVWDIRSNELNWSDEIYRIFGLTPKQSGTTYEAFLNSVHPGDREFVKKTINEALYGRPYNIDHRIILPDGSVKFVHEQGEVTFGESDEPVRMLGTVQDVTDKKEQEIRLIMSERLAALGQMASGIAHEINNPLATIAACSEGLINRLKKGRFEKELFQNYLDIIVQEVSRCKGITTSMLSFVRKTIYEKKKIDIHKVLDKTIELIGFQGRLKDVSVIKKYHGTLTTHESEGDMRQVFLAIMLNALDAMEDRGVLTIETGMYPSALNAKSKEPGKGGSIFIIISDTGKGIPSGLNGKIFDSFFTTKSEKGGTGLGLSIANKIIKDHNGSIRVTSEKGEGAAFHIVLPK
jgi:PAS domain S-box-containing protein